MKKGQKSQKKQFNLYSRLIWCEIDTILKKVFSSQPSDNLFMSCCVSLPSWMGSITKFMLLGFVEIMLTVSAVRRWKSTLFRSNFPSHHLIIHLRFFPHANIKNSQTNKNKITQFPLDGSYGMWCQCWGGSKRRNKFLFR